jgi:HAD superfamily hydrolase (TIGR01459 family)
VIMTPQRDNSPVDLIGGLHTIADRYDLILCDVWGVLHDGLVAFAPASDALVRFRDKGGRVVLISNAPRPGSGVAVQLDKLGVPRAAYDTIVTSGDLTRSVVRDRLPAIVHHLGPPRDRPIFDGLGVRFGSIEASDYVVCSGFDDDDVETVDDYRARLEAMRARDLFMVCANPDLVVERGDLLVPCAGALALAYEEIGGAVYYAGKPHRPIYDEALRVAARLSAREAIRPERVLAVGDAIRTDIAGASGLGVDSLLVARGIHAAELRLDEGVLVSQHVQDWLETQEVRPTAVTDALAWT